MLRLISVSMVTTSIRPSVTRLTGSVTKRSRLDGTRTSAVSVEPAFGRVSSNAIVSPRFGMNGNGCAGSTAIGVRTGKISSRNSFCR